MLANQAGAESGDVNVLQQKQRELKVRNSDFHLHVSSKEVTHMLLSCSRTSNVARFQPC